MALIPAIADDIVNDNIIPLLPWHTRPLLMSLSRAWRRALEAIGVQGGNQLNRVGEHTATATRSMQPLKCRLAVEYSYIYKDSVSGGVVKVLDGQWRNVPPIGGRWPYTYTNFVDGNVLGVVDGRLYVVHDDNDIIRIIVLDVGSGLWQWKEVCRSENHPHIHNVLDILDICRSSRVAGDLLVYCRQPDSLIYWNIEEIPAWQRITDQAPDFYHDVNVPLPIFVQVGNRLYFFGALSYNQGVRFFDLNNRTWNNGMVHVGGSVNVEKNVLLVAYNGTHFHILRYDSSNERWMRAGWMLPPAVTLLEWTWCVEYDEEGEKQLWIYIWSQGGNNVFNVCKWQVVEKLPEGRLDRKVWDDMVLPEGEVECKLDNSTPVEQDLPPVEQDFSNGDAPELAVSTFCGFHRSDTTNFEDIPTVNPR